MADINAWLEKVEKRYYEYPDAPSADIPLLVTKLRAALKVVEPLLAMERDNTQHLEYSPECACSACSRIFTALEPFRALCEKEGRDG